MRMIKVTCIVKVEPSQYGAVFSMLSGLGLKAFEAPPADPSVSTTNSNDAIGCYKIFQDRDIPNALALPAVLQEIPGVKSVAPHYESIDDPKLQPQIKEPPRSWKKRLIPIILSSFVTFLVVASAVEHYRALLDPDHLVEINPWTIALILGAPTAITFAVQAIFKFFAEENPQL